MDAIFSVWLSCIFDFIVTLITKTVIGYIIVLCMVYMIILAIFSLPRRLF